MHFKLVVHSSKGGLVAEVEIMPRSSTPELGPVPGNNGEEGEEGRRREHETALFQKTDHQLRFGNGRKRWTA